MSSNPKITLTESKHIVNIATTRRASMPECCSPPKLVSSEAIANHSEGKALDEETLSPFSRMALKKTFSFEKKPQILSPRLAKSQSSKLDELEHLRPVESVVRRRASTSDAELAPNIPSVKILWKRESIWQHNITRISKYLTKTTWIFYYNNDDHHMEIVHNSLTGFRALIVSGKVLLEAGGNDQLWCCNCSATSRATKTRFNCELGLAPLPALHGVAKAAPRFEYFIKIDGR